MRLDPDCMRAILLEAEKAPFDEELGFRDLCDSLSSCFLEEDIRYTCLKLEEAGLLKIKAAMRNSPHHLPIVLSIVDITYMGHQFLANIREDSVWNKVKGIAGKAGCTSVSALIQIATAILPDLIRASLG